MSKSNVLFLMTGSIACYKACQVISRLVQQGHEVQVVATTSALQFVGAATLEGLSGKPVVSDLYGPGNMMDHIHLMRWADLVVVAPATANYINKISQGVGDDLATTLFLAHDFKKPFFLAPAMNTSMYEHPITSANLKRLQELGLMILGTATGTLACGESGQGKLLDPDQILNAISSTIAEIRKGTDFSNRPLGEVPSRKSNQVPFSQVNLTSGDFSEGEIASSLALAGVPAVKPFRVLVTAGGTFEPLDGVRGITNLSTGGTGARLAELFTEFGMETTLLRAQTAKSPRFSFGIREVTFTSFASLESKLKTLLAEEEFDAVVHAAAVSDFAVDEIEVNGTVQAPGVSKLHSTDKLTIRFKNNPKLVDHIKAQSRQPNLQLVAFKLTNEATSDERDLAVWKLTSHAPVDLVVQNDMSEIDKASNHHAFTIHKNDQKLTVNGVDALATELIQYFLRSKK